MLAMGSSLFLSWNFEHFKLFSLVFLCLVEVEAPAWQGGWAALGLLGQKGLGRSEDEQGCRRRRQHLGCVLAVSLYPVESSVAIQQKGVLEKQAVLFCSTSIWEIKILWEQFWGVCYGKSKNFPNNVPCCIIPISCWKDQLLLGAFGWFEIISYMLWGSASTQSLNFMPHVLLLCHKLKEYVIFYLISELEMLRWKERWMWVALWSGFHHFSWVSSWFCLVWGFFRSPKKFNLTLCLLFASVLSSWHLLLLWLWLLS